VTRVYDCFIFSRELDLLEIRLNELSPVVDVFVLAESPLTFQGEPKPLVYRENRERFAPFADRIRHVVVGDMPAGAAGRDHWRRQSHQRNALAAGLDDARPDDVVLLSDVDEIVRATTLRAVTDGRDPRPTVHCLEQRMYKYFLNSQHRDPWSRSGPRAVRRRYLRSMQGLRYVRPPTPDPLGSTLRWLSACAHMRQTIRRIVHRDAGWHFSAMGGVDEVATRLSSNSQIVRERRREPGRDFTEIAAARIENARFDSSLKQVPLDDSFPAYLVANRGRYRHLLADDDLPTRDVATPSPP
jgi:beta-1,4-mannosyl-glycoprotein beta-1,4-N-acetylglucosaminyltransferase